MPCAAAARPSSIMQTSRVVPPMSTASRKGLSLNAGPPP